MTTVARPLSAGMISRLVSLRISLRGLDSEEDQLELVGLALLRVPLIWVRALSEASGGVLALWRVSSAQTTISGIGVCFGGRAYLWPLARTDVWGCFSSLEARLTTHWLEEAGYVC